MAYRFNGSTDFVEFAIAPLVGFNFGAFTMAMFLRRGAVSTTQVTMGTADSANSVANTYNRFSSANVVQQIPGPNSGPTLSSTSLWYLLVITANGGGTTLRFHVHDGTSWTHTNGTSWPGIAAVGSSDRLFVGLINAVLALNADVVCAGIKKTNSVDATVQTLTRTAFADWQAFGFDWLIGFDTSLKTGGLLQDQASPGTGDQVAISGTTVVADPPGWVWASAVAPVADFTATPLTGVEPLSVAFTDASTNTPTGWAWTFGDGGTSSSQNPSHTYTAAGTYTVTLQATNSAGSNTKTRTGYVTVGDQPRPVRINTSGGWVDIADQSSFVSGTGAPTVAVGATGAIYLDVATGRMYGPKAAGAWPGTSFGRLLLPGNTYADVAASYTDYARLLAG